MKCRDCGIRAGRPLLRGGEGSIIGVVIGAAVMVVLSNTINLVHPAYQNVEFAIIGGVILIGVTVDGLPRRIVIPRRRSDAARRTVKGYICQEPVRRGLHCFREPYSKLPGQRYSTPRRRRLSSNGRKRGYED